VLFGENLRRRHERDVEAAFQRHQRGAGRDRRFARADIALQQTAHRMRAAHVRADFAQDAGLRSGEFETELREERFDEVVVAGAGEGFGAGFKFFAPRLDLDLQLDELIEREPLPREFHIGQLLREMNHAHGVGAGRAMRFLKG
jgi:hypothetical protein